MGDLEAGSQLRMLQGRPAEPDSARALQDLATRLGAGYRSVGALAYEVLRDAILTGALAPGQKLRQESLAELIGVSRVPVRSALIQLEADGLVELHDRRGAVVKSLSAAQLSEVYDLRILLESEALRRSMRTMSHARIVRLRELARQTDAEVEGSGFVDARAEFYAELYDAVNRPIQWELIEQLRLKVGRYVLGWRLVDGHEHAHEALIEAVAAGKSGPAVKVLQEHLRSVRDAVVGVVTTEERQRFGDRA